MGVRLEPGSVFAGFRLEGAVGRGGMGVVYRARDEALERPVALKLVAPELAADARFRERFLRESRLAASIDHPHVLPVYGAGEHDGQLYLASRFVEGEDLGCRLAREGRLGLGEAVRIAGAAAEALDAAHAKGLVHRDVKPGNVLLDASGEVYLADFGLTKRSASESGLTGTGEFVGTLDYLAPEQIRGGRVDGRADQYALACLLYACLAGVPPFRREGEAQTLWAHMQEPPPSLHARRPELPAAADEALARALAKEAEQRYESCGAFVAAFRAALGLEARPLRRPLLPVWVRRRPRLLLLLGALLVAGAAAAAAAIQLTKGESTPIAIVAGDGLALLPPDGNGPAAGMALPGRPVQAVTAVGRVWVGGDGTVAAVDPVSREVVEVVATDAQTTDLAAGEGALWLLDGEAGLLLRIEPEYAAVADRIELAPAQSGGIFGRTQGAVAAGEGAVWIVDGSWAVQRLDPATGEIAALVNTGHPLNGIAVGAGAVWAISGEDATVVEVDPEENRLVSDIPIAALPGSASPYPIAVAVGEGSVWTLNGNTATVTRIDPEVRGVTATVPIGVGRSPTALAAGGGAVWVANAADGTIARVDVRTHEVRSILVGSHPTDIVLDGDGVWVAVEAGLGAGPLADARAIVEASTPEYALPASFCSPVYSLRGQEPRFLIVSDLPLQGSAALLTAQMSDAIRFVLAERGYRAGDYAVGYQSCDAADAQTGFSSEERCVANARAYVERPRVLGVVGSFFSGCSYAQIPIANAAPDGPLAIISPSNTYVGLTHAGSGAAAGEPESLYPTGKRSYVRVLPADDYQAAAVALLAQRLGLRKVYTLAASPPYGPGLAAAFVEAAGRLGISVVGQAEWDQEASSYEDVAARAAATDPDAVFLAGYRETGLVRDLRAALRAGVRIMAPDGFFPAAELVRGAGVAAEGMTVSVPGFPPERLTGAGGEFVSELGRAIGAPVEPFSVYAAAATEILLEAIAGSDGTRASVTANLLETEIQDGILGAVSFDENGDPATKAVTIYEIRNGRAEVLDVVVPPDDLVGR